MSDNLESYFRKHLKDETPGEDAWNVPSDSVWEKVQPGISKRKGIFIPWKYFYIFGIGLILMISTLVLLPENAEDLVANKNTAITKSGKADHNKTIENNSGLSEGKVEESNIDSKLGFEPSSTQVSFNESVAETVPNSNATKNNTSVEAGLLTEQTVNATSASDHTDQLIEDEKPESQNNASIATLIAVSSGGDGGNKVNQANTYNSGDRYSNYPNTAKIISRVDEEILESYVFVYSNTIDYFADDQGFAGLKGFDYLNAQKANPIPFSQGKFGVGAYYSPTYTSTEVKGLELPGNDQMGNHFLFSNNWGFDFYYYVSYRFTLVSGVGSSEIRSWSKTTSQFNYDPSTEHDMGNNQSANSTTQTSPTPFGALSSEVVYSFSSDDKIPDGELMESVSETFQNIRYLSIPLGIEYNLLNQEKSLWFLETGVNYNLSMRDQTKLIPQILHDGDEMNIMDSKITQDPDYENNYWGFYIGTGYKYPVNRRIQLLGTVRYNRSISPLKSLGSATTDVQGYQLKVGVVYLLH